MDLDHLNPAQRDAVQQLDGALLVLAGAGTGKTTVITHRIAALLRSGIPARHILAVTFTNKAASEMKARLITMLPEFNTKRMFVGTFHAFGCSVLRRFGDRLGYSKAFAIADTDDQNGVLKQVLTDMKLGEGELKFEFFKNGIRHANNNMQNAEGIRNSGRMSWFSTLADVYDAYQRRLKSMNLVDFDDLLGLPVKLWTMDQRILEEYRDRYRYLLIDEYQDTNRIQAEMIRLLSGTRKNICAVGDDDQCIYGWRGAEVNNILEFEKGYPGARIFKLEQNYRSTNNILAAANAVITNNSRRHTKTLWSEGTSGDQIKLFEVATETVEANVIADLVQDIRYEKDIPYNEIAILFRSNFQSRVFEQSLREHRIPYRIVGAKAFYERREIKDALAYLKVLHNKADNMSLLRILNVPSRGIGEKTVEKLKEIAETTDSALVDALENEEFLASTRSAVAKRVREFSEAFQRGVENFDESMSLSAKVRLYLDDIGYLAGLKTIYKIREEQAVRVENVEEFINSAALFEERFAETASLQNFLESYALMDDNDRVREADAEIENVTLMTVHAAKGLEYEIVIVAGLEEDLFPHELSVKEDNLEEERRLFYVALTRAKQQLVLSRARTRMRYNRKEIRCPSQFIAELPQELIDSTQLRNEIAPAKQEYVSSIFDTMRERYS